MVSPLNTQTNETAKAAVVVEKHRAIVRAARGIFLRDGFAGASMDAIASAAGVSVKTIYSHFENKGELFSEVMIGACTDHLLSSELPSNAVLADRFSWFTHPTQRGLMQAGKDYLHHLLSEEQLALYRVITRDADHFPELGLHYQRNVAQGRTRILTAYLKRTARSNGWGDRKSAQDANLYEALLRAGIYEEVLHGVLTVDAALIDRQARSAANAMWKWLTINRD